MSKLKDFGLLHKLEYPPYEIICNGLTSFIVCGGGSGTYKSGIPNNIEVYDLLTVKANDNLALPVLKIRTCYNTDIKIASSLDVHFNYLITAEKNDLCEYILIDNSLVKLNDENKDKETVELKLHRRISNVFMGPEEDTDVSVVRYCGNSGSLIIAGGSTGSVKIFQRYNEEKPMDLVPHREIFDVSEDQGRGVIDLDVSPSGEEFVSICDHPAGKYARVWSIARGVKVTELALTSPQSKKLPIKCAYKFRHCRYGPTFYGAEGRPSFLLYCTHVPTKRDPTQPSFMSVWGPGDPGTGSDYQLIDAIPLGNNKAPLLNSKVKLVPSVLAVSGNGLLSSIGSAEGQVDVYRFDPAAASASKLSLIYRLPLAHSFVVLAMTFLPSSRVLATGHEFELVSAAMDNMVRYHRLPSQPRYRRLEKLYSVLCLCIVMFFCDRLLLALNLW